MKKALLNEKDVKTEEKITKRLKSNKAIDREFLELVYRLVEEEKELLKRLARE